MMEITHYLKENIHNYILISRRQNIKALRLEECYSCTEKNSTKKTRKTTQITEENYVQQTINSIHIGAQQIHSSGTTYLLMCLTVNTVKRSFIN